MIPAVRLTLRRTDGWQNSSCPNGRAQTPCRSVKRSRIWYISLRTPQVGNPNYSSSVRLQGGSCDPPAQQPRGRSTDPPANRELYIEQFGSLSMTIAEFTKGPAAPSGSPTSRRCCQRSRTSHEGERSSVIAIIQLASRPSGRAQPGTRTGRPNYAVPKPERPYAAAGFWSARSRGRRFTHSAARSTQVRRYEV
jgi:hypothetical protein